MVWSLIDPLEVAPGGRILEPLMFRMRDNPIFVADQASVGIPTAELARVPQCLRTAELSRLKALKKNGANMDWGTPPKWNLSAFQTPGAWAMPAAPSALVYFIEMWGAGASGQKAANVGGGGSGAYGCFYAALTVGQVLSGIIGLGGSGSWVTGGNTTFTYPGGSGLTLGAVANVGGLGSSKVGSPTLLLSLNGNDAEAVGFGAGFWGAGNPGAPAPLIGGASSAKLSTVTPVTYVENPVVGCGGRGAYATQPNSQKGGNGMVLVWWLA